MSAILAEGMGGGDSGTSTGAIVLVVVLVLAAGALVVRSQKLRQARARVQVRTTPDAGVVQLLDLPAPGAAPSMAVGTRVTPDHAGEVTLTEVTG